MPGLRSTLARDAEQARSLGLSWADGDRVVTIPRYPCGSTDAAGHYRTVMGCYWSVTWRTPDGTAVRSGVASTERLARTEIAAAVAAG